MHKYVYNLINILAYHFLNIFLFNRFQKFTDRLITEHLLKIAYRFNSTITVLITITHIALLYNTLYDCSSERTRKHAIYQ